MEDLHDGYTLLLCTVNQSLQSGHEGLYILIVPVRSVTEGFLNINDKQCCT
jgi:hypothetical protein